MTSRIQGRRWAVFVFSEDYEIIAVPVMARFELWAQALARNVPFATVVDVDTKEATRIARAGAVMDDTTLAELCKASGCSRPFMRSVLREQIAKGKGLIPEGMRAELLDRKAVSDPALADAKRAVEAQRRKLRTAERKVRELEDACRSRRAKRAPMLDRGLRQTDGRAWHGERAVLDALQSPTPER